MGELLKGVRSPQEGSVWEGLPNLVYINIYGNICEGGSDIMQPSQSIDILLTNCHKISGWSFHNHTNLPK